MLYFSKELLMKAPYKRNQVLGEYTVPGTYTLDVKASGVYEIEAISGGGGGMFCDGGVDTFPETAWAYHYYVRGATGCYVKGTLRIPRGVHTITIGSGGYGQNLSPSGNGGNTQIDDLFIITGAYGCGYDGHFNSGVGGHLQTQLLQTIAYAEGSNDGHYLTVKDNNQAGDFSVNYIHSAPIPENLKLSFGYGGYAKGWQNVGYGAGGYLKISYKGR